MYLSLLILFSFWQCLCFLFYSVTAGLHKWNIAKRPIWLLVFRECQNGAPGRLHCCLWRMWVGIFQWCLLPPQLRLASIHDRRENLSLLVFPDQENNTDNTIADKSLRFFFLLFLQCSLALPVSLCMLKST